MTLESRLIARRTLSADEPIGYGDRFITQRPPLTSVVALGYADGYPRAAEDKVRDMRSRAFTRFRGLRTRRPTTIEPRLPVFDQSP